MYKKLANYGVRNPLCDDVRNIHKEGIFMQLTKLLEEYLYELKLKNYSERTIKSVKNNNALFFSWLKSEYDIEDAEEVHRVHIKAYIKYKQGNKLKPTYINSILKTLRMYFKYLELEEYIDINPILKVGFQKEEKVIIQRFTLEEMQRMVNVFGFHNFLSARNRCIITMLFDTGIRNFELCNIQCDDIKERTIVIYGKGNKQRIVPISPVLQKTMLKYEDKREKYIKERYQDEYYFLSQKGRKLTIETIERIVKEAGEYANVSKEIRCSPHTCRHTFAQMNIRNGLDVYSLSRLLGHENIMITKRYLQSMKDEEVIEMAIKTSPLMNLKSK